MTGSTGGSASYRRASALPARGAAAWMRLAATMKRRIFRTDGFTLLATVVLVAVIAALNIEFPRFMALGTLSLPIFLGGYLLSVRSLAVLLAAVAALVGVWALAVDDHARLPGVTVLLLLTALLALTLARSRSRLGVQGSRGDTMLVDLRDRLNAGGRIPALPRGWSADVVTRSAGGSSFSGDFVVAAGDPAGERLEVALIDVSGKGVDAGTRALLLSGAFGGLLGAVPPAQFLPAANRYLERQQWAEGFATAVHVSLDLRTGDYVVTSAGHPPAVHFVAGSGTWLRREGAHGPLLGVVDGAPFPGEAGRLERGDALLLYTDGLVEVPGRDLDVGIDRLIGAAEGLVPQGFEGGASRLLRAVGAGENDDRAVVLVWRS